MFYICLVNSFKGYIVSEGLTTTCRKRFIQDCTLSGWDGVIFCNSSPYGGVFWIFD